MRATSPPLGRRPSHPSPCPLATTRATRAVHSATAPFTAPCTAPCTAPHPQPHALLILTPLTAPEQPHPHPHLTHRIPHRRRPALTGPRPARFGRRGSRLVLSPAERQATGFAGLLADYTALGDGCKSVLRHNQCKGAALRECRECPVRDKMHEVARLLTRLRGAEVVVGDVSRTLIYGQHDARRVAERCRATLSGTRLLLSDNALALLACSGAIDLKHTLDDPAPVVGALLRGLASHDGIAYGARVQDQLRRLQSGTFERLPRPPLGLLSCPATAGSFITLSGNADAFSVLFALLAATVADAAAGPGAEATEVEGVLQGEEMRTLLEAAESEDASEDLESAIMLLLCRLAPYVDLTPAADAFGRARPQSLAPRVSVPAPGASAAVQSAAALRTDAVTLENRALEDLVCSDPTLAQLRPMLSHGAFSDSRSQRVALRVFRQLRSSDAVIGATGATAADTVRELMLLAADQVRALTPGAICSSLPQPQPHPAYCTPPPWPRQHDSLDTPFHQAVCRAARVAALTQARSPELLALAASHWRLAPAQQVHDRPLNRPSPAPAPAHAPSRPRPHHSPSPAP